LIRPIAGMRSEMPITEEMFVPARAMGGERGSPDQFTFSLGVSYSFDIKLW
jgi:hypothetical protein